MDEQLETDLRDHLAKIVLPEQLDGIHTMCLSILEVSLEKGLKDLNVGLPPFLSWSGSDHAPVEEIVKEWKLKPFIDRARAEADYE
jgi:hypothetical protein